MNTAREDNAVEAELRRELEELRALVDHTPDMIARFDRNLRHCHVNRAVEMCMDMPAAALLGKTDRELGLPPELVDLWEQNFRQVFATGTEARMEFVFPTLSGPRIFEARLVPERSPTGEVEFVLAVARDVHAQRMAEADRARAEERVRQTDDRLRRQYLGFPVPTYTWQRSGDDFILIDHNDAARADTDGDSATWIGRRLRDWNPYRADILADFTRCLAEQRTFRREMQLALRSDGMQREIVATYVFIPPDLVMSHIEDVTERRRARRELQEYTRRLEEAQEAERLRIARELHDEVGQQLTGLTLVLSAASRTAIVSDARVAEAQAIATDLLSTVRDLSLRLRPPMLDDLGLLPALEWLIDSLSSQTAIAMQLQHRGSKRRFTPETDIAAFRIVQEALTNVARHSGARRARVRVTSDADCLKLSIVDDGHGFAADWAGHPSSGLTGMRQRAAAVGGSVSIASRGQRGTVVRARLPLSPTI